ncbi:MAG: tetratricopeptide repeat protein [Deltaproteobacteria bacterium]|nr:tetratricopeptide repeat protein [Deltaproteobacteria bacterium]
MRVRWLLVLALICRLCLMPGPVEAKPGCCAGHGGVCGGKCCDGTPLSVKCSGPGKGMGAGSGKSGQSPSSTAGAAPDTSGDRQADDSSRTITPWHQFRPRLPDAAGVYLEQGDIYLDHGEYRRAIREYSDALEKEPKNAVALNNRGIALYRLGQYAEAVSDYDQAIMLDPGYAKAYFNRGLARHKSGDPDRALSDFKASARLGHRSAQEWLKAKGSTW